MGDISFEDAKNFLLRDENGNNLYDHLTRVLSKLIVESPEESFDSFEAISRYMKDSVVKPKLNKVKTITDKALLAKQQEWIKQTLALTEEPKDDSENVMTITGLQDWMRDSRLFEWAGVGFPAQENYAIYCSLRKLASVTEGIKNLRLFGKIFGQNADYIVAEGEIEGGDDNSEEGNEPRGTGCNKFVYWVSSDATKEWTMLPDVTPAQIVAARQLKRVLTGDLTAPVITYPPFPGSEVNYLRALIALIAADTVLCPAGAYVNPEDEENADHLVQKNEDEDWTFPSAEELKAFEGWTHIRSGILKTGRVAYPIVDSEEQPELAETIDAMKDEDPEQPALRTLDTDKPVVPNPDGDDLGAEGAWALTTCGDKCVHSVDDKEVSYGVTVLTSLRWPGALNVAQGNVYAHIYVGYGFQAGLPAFSPSAPADIQEEPQEAVEEPEPTPLEEQIESDGGEEEDGGEDEDEEDL